MALVNLRSSRTFSAEIVPAKEGWKLEVKWIAKDARGSFCSPVASQKYCYFVSSQGVLYCLDRSNGDELYHERLPCGMCWATPIVHGGYLYLFGKSGQTMTIKDGEKFEVVSPDNRVWQEDDPTITAAPEKRKRLMRSVNE